MKPQILATISFDYMTWWLFFSCFLASTLMVPSFLNSFAYFVGNILVFSPLNWHRPLASLVQCFKPRFLPQYAYPSGKQKTFFYSNWTEISQFQTQQKPGTRNTAMVFFRFIRKQWYFSRSWKSRHAAAAARQENKRRGSFCVGITLHELGEVNDRVIVFAVVIVVRAHTVVWLIDFGQKNALLDRFLLHCGLVGVVLNIFWSRQRQ